MRAAEFITEAFNQPYATDLSDETEDGDYDSLTQLPDGSYLTVMFNNQGDGEYQVEFWRGPSQGVTGEGDAQRIFATVLSTIQRFIKEHNPWRLTFSATKDVEPGQNSESRAKLYNRLVDRYAAAWGYDAYNEDHGDQVEYELTRLKPNVAEGQDDNGISFQVQKGKNKFATTLSIGNNPVGVYQYDANTGRSIAEVYPEFKGKGLGKLLVLHAIYTAAKLGLDFQEDESRTSEYDNVLDSLSGSGYIVDDEGYWYVTGEGEQFLKQSLKQGVAEGSLGTALPWPNVVNKVSGAMKAMGWKGTRKADGTFMFSTRGQETDDQYYIVIIDNAGEGFFTYALGTIEEGDPRIGEQESLPNTEASVSELMNAIRDGFGLSEQGVAEEMQHKKITELFDVKTSFPLKWDTQFASRGEVHAEAYDADGRTIDISFTPTGYGSGIEIVFKRGGSYDMTGHGDAPRVLATVVNAISQYLQKYQPPYIAFSAKSTGGRAGAYAAMIRRLARGYKLLTPDEYPDDTTGFLDFLGSDKPFILARS